MLQLGTCSAPCLDNMNVMLCYNMNYRCEVIIRSLSISAVKLLQLGTNSCTEQYAKCSKTTVVHLEENLCTLTALYQGVCLLIGW